MIVGVGKETVAGERRVAVTPDAARLLTRAGLELLVEAGAGTAAGFPDAEYAASGATIAVDGAEVLARAEVVLKVRGPEARTDGSREVDALTGGKVVIGLLRPLDHPAGARELAARGVTSFAMELLPRITRAQGMDALSSQSNLAGYRSVLLASVTIRKAFPMMVTAAGTISPARVLILGAGVAGLQAIATARRLGALVEAYDVRPAVKEQVESLGARFVELALETRDAEGAGGYARAQSEEYYARQRALLGERVRAADVVITTALVPGKPAPRLVDPEDVRAMRPGSVIVDLAAEQGGNCSDSRPDETVVVGGVTILGPTNLPSDVAFHASQMYARNVTTFLLHLVKDGALRLDLEDELTRAPLLTHQGEITNETVRTLLEGGGS
jgi:proton-translocating NAD(P)+ transhydrogenase subunit alpha